MECLKLKRFLLFVFSLIFILGMTFVTVQADKSIYVQPNQKAKVGQHKWAVIIGVNEYEDEAISDLQYAVNDAEKLYQLLIDPNYGGFEERKVNLITDNTNKKPTRENILIALNGLEDVSQQDSIFIFFSPEIQ